MKLVGEFTETELELIEILNKQVDDTANSYSAYVIDEVTRKSDREFDLSVEGVHEFYWKREQRISAVEITEHGRKDMGTTVVPANKKTQCRFSGWLPLHAIKQILNWPHRDIAALTDYPSMVVTGDWSGIRDSSEDKIWGIFEKFFIVDEDSEFRPRQCHYQR